MLNFKIKNTDGKARTGELNLNSHKIQTPCFMPVGTAATVKTIAVSIKICAMAVIPNIHMLLKYIENVIHHIHARTCITMCLVFKCGIFFNGLMS